MADLLVNPGSGDDLEWLQRQGAVWDGVLDAAGADPSLARALATVGGSPSMRGLIESVASDASRTVTAVPVNRVSVGAADAGFTLAPEAADFVAQRLGHLALREGDRPRVEILNGNGLIGTTRVVAGQLIRRGYRVIKTDNADSFDFETTQVVAQGRENQADAEAVIEVLGTGELLLEVRAPSGVVDITIIVGADVPAGEG